jgi:hypothetical protein
VERQSVYPHHHGRVHTLLPGPVTITIKGVKQGQVIGLYSTDGNDAWCNLNNILDWSRVGGVCVIVPEVEEELKYGLGLEELLRWSGRSFKPSCSKWKI